MRRAAAISAQAHIRAMQCSARMLRVGEDVREYHLDAELLHEFRRQGSQAVAYNSIVAAAPTPACCTTAPTPPWARGELVLIDAGCELDGYASDITRTFPDDGRFTGPAARALRTWCGSQDAPWPPPAPAPVSTTRTTPPWRCCRRACWTGLLDRNKVGTVQDVIEKRAYFQFYMHRTGHWLGNGRARLRQLRGAHRGRPGQPAARPAVGEAITNRPSRILHPAWC